MNTPSQLPENSIHCSNCLQPISKDAKYCPHCGTYQKNRQRQEILEQGWQKWKIIKEILIFYTIYLVTIIPLFRLDSHLVAPGILIVAGVDALIILGYWFIGRTSILPLFRFYPVTFRYALIAVGVLLALLMVNFFYHEAITDIFIQKRILITKFFIRAGFGFPVIVFGLCLMPAIWEEIAFRGLIQTSLDKKFSKWEAIFITSGMFAIIHISLFSWPYLFLLGIVLGLIREYSQSLWPSIFMHFLHNFIVVLIEYSNIPGT
jgi:membrane protease YdiL (CAAX protease family)